MSDLGWDGDAIRTGVNNWEHVQGTARQLVLQIRQLQAMPIRNGNQVPGDKLTPMVEGTLAQQDQVLEQFLSLLEKALGIKSDVVKDVDKLHEVVEDGNAQIGGSGFRGA